MGKTVAEVVELTVTACGMVELVGGGSSPHSGSWPFLRDRNDALSKPRLSG